MATKTDRLLSGAPGAKTKKALSVPGAMHRAFAAPPTALKTPRLQRKARAGELEFSPLMHKNKWDDSSGYGA